ncbi:MAG: DUF1127 domain-containing protein [Pseudomonadota bacterium]
MAYANTQSTSRSDLFARLRAYGAGLAASWTRYRLYRETYAQLSELNDRELLDLGLSRAGLRAAAWENAHQD